MISANKVKTSIRARTLVTAAKFHNVGDVTPSQMSTFEPTTRDFAGQFVIHSKPLFPKFLLLEFMGLVHESIIRHL